MRKIIWWLKAPFVDTINYGPCFMLTAMPFILSVALTIGGILEGDMPLILGPGCIALFSGGVMLMMHINAMPPDARSGNAGQA